MSDSKVSNTGNTSSSLDERVVPCVNEPVRSDDSDNKFAVNFNGGELLEKLDWSGRCAVEEKNEGRKKLAGWLWYMFKYIYRNHNVENITEQEIASLKRLFRVADSILSSIYYKSSTVVEFDGKFEEMVESALRNIQESYSCGLPEGIDVAPSIGVAAGYLEDALKHLTIKNPVDISMYD